MLVLSKEDIKKVFTMKEALQSSREALRMHSQGKSIVPLRINIGVQKAQGQSLFMPAYVEEQNALGIKIVSIFPENIERGKPSTLGKMILLDNQTGDVCCIIDGTYLTQLRTGALQGVATDILARKNAKIAVLFGTGGQAATQLEAMLHVRDLEEIKVIGTNFARTELFVATMKKEFSKFNTKISAISDADCSIKEADIITTITTSNKPVFNGTLVKKGAHINGIGAYTPQMQELPEILVQGADKIVFDTKDGVLAEAGDILIPLQAGLITNADFQGELGEIILGHVKGRETEQEITIFKAVGTAVIDVIMARKIYEKALAANVGKNMSV